MAATVVPSVMVNVDALNRYNYDYWFFRVETYLLAEDLWDVVEGTYKPPKPEDPELKAWRKNNARALQAIIIFCGEDAESFLKHITTAKEAWNILEKHFKPHSEDTSEVDLNDDQLERIDGDEHSELQMAGAHASFFSAVRCLNWEAVKKFILQKPPLIRAKSENTDKTALHLAVQFKDVTGVKMLLEFTQNKDLEMVDRDGHTPLSMAILEKDTDEMIEIAECIVEKNKKLLLHIVDPSTNTIPLLMALSLDRPKMTRYLYRNTPLEKLKKRDRAELLSTSFRVKLLDISWDLIQRFPCLATAQDHSGESPLNALAGTAGLFLNASQLGIWKQWIYNCIHVPPTPTRIPEVSVDVQEEERDQGNQKNLIRDGIHVPPTPTRIPEVSVDVQKEESDQGNQKNLIREVSCFFGGLVANLLHLSGINCTRIYQMKLLHVKTIEILKCMLELLKSEDDLDTRQQKLVQKALFQAVERGHAPFIYHLLIPNPRFLAMTDEHDKTVFQFAVERRQDEIFNLIHEFDEQKRKDIVGRKDKFGNNMLHVVGRLSPLTQITHIRGAALQMQKELQWFKNVEGMASPKDLNCINSEGHTPREEFTVNHRNLMEAGEKSIKETATSSSALVAALIITIMFAATVATPGGIKDIKGIPIYLDTKAFQIFIVADVTSLCTSTTSVMIFLGILTSRFSEEDFLTSLPTKLIIGFLTLFLSVAAMMIAFSSSIFIMLCGQQSIVNLSIVLAVLPIASFLWMQFPFLRDIIISTSGFRQAFKSRVEIKV